MKQSKNVHGSFQRPTYELAETLGFVSVGWLTPHWSVATGN